MTGFPLWFVSLTSASSLILLLAGRLFNPPKTRRRLALLVIFSLGRTPAEEYTVEHCRYIFMCSQCRRFFLSSLFLSALRTSCSCCRKTSYERMPPFSAVSITSLNKTESWASLDYTSRCDSMFPARCSSDRQNADKKKTELTRPLWRRSRFLPIKFWGGKEKTKRRGKQGKTPPPLSTASSYNNNKNITSMYNERYVI